MTTHIPNATEVRTAQEAEQAARTHRRAAAAIARREAAVRGDYCPDTTPRQRVAAPVDPSMHRGAAPQQAGNKRTWNIHHAAADALVQRAAELHKEERMNAAPAPNSTEEALMARIADLEEQMLIRTAANAADARRNAPTSTSTVRVVEQATYTREAADAGHRSWLTDLYRAQIKGDPAAGERLARHGREIESSGRMTARDISSANVSGFVPPQYLSELFAELARAGRPTADLVTRLKLPERGMTIAVPKITTGSTVAAQASELGAVSEGSFDDTLLSVPVNTVAGMIDVSRQAIERGELVESIVFGDLAAAYNAELDRLILAGSGGSGEHTGILATSSINSITYTDASPTVAELWPKLADAVGQVVSQRYTGPTAIVMQPETWAWMLASLDTANRPLVAPVGAANAFGTVAPPQYANAAGTLLGKPVILDGNMPTNLGTGTNETRIVVADFRDSFLFEDPNASPAQLRFDSVGSSVLAVRLIAYGYSAFTAARQPKAVSVISGTGLITPSL